MLQPLLARPRRRCDSLSEQEILALAIEAEERGRAYLLPCYDDGLRETYPDSPRVFDGMAEEEDRHRRRLIEMHKSRFGDRIPLIRRAPVRGYPERAPDWLVRPLGSRRPAPWQSDGAPGRAVLPGRRRAWRGCRHAQAAGRRWRRPSTGMSASPRGWRRGTAPCRDQRAEADVRAAALRADLCAAGAGRAVDGSVSTLAPIFAAAFVTGDMHATFLVELSASVGAGISMGFTEAASDDGVISGRGSPLIRAW